MAPLRIMAYATILFSLAAVSVHGADEEQPFNDLLVQSDAACRAVVIGNDVFEKTPHHRIFTATAFAVAETFKGIFSNTVRVEHRGGNLDGRGEYHCGMPQFKEGGDYLLFIARHADGSLYCLHYLEMGNPGYSLTLEQLRQSSETREGTGEDVSDQQATLMTPMSLLDAYSGISSRFIQCDRGEPIEYVVDMDAWPAGITSNQALGAVSNAFAAWSNASSLTFKFGGVESFGMAAPDLVYFDDRIYIQLHDNYNYIPPSSTLAKGGRSYRYNAGTWPDGGLGGRVGTNEFDRTIEGYLVVEHSKTSLSTLSNFEEVLCHEIGHVLSLGHSSTDGSETNALLEDATMFFQAHLDGRAASIREWDTNTIHIIHPAANTPPYGYDRVIRAITSPSPQAALTSAVNQVELASHDLQGGAYPVLISSTTMNGVFSLEATNTVFYLPGGWYGDSAEVGSSSYYDSCYIRMSDGVNLSPPIQIRVIQLLSDGNNDDLPDSWVSSYGISGGTAGDFDHDGFTNLDEWLLGTNPNDAQSHFKVGLEDGDLSWNSRPYDLYQLQSANGLQNAFTNEGNPIPAALTNETVSIQFDAQRFYRVQRLK